MFKAIKRGWSIVGKRNKTECTFLQGKDLFQVTLSCLPPKHWGSSISTFPWEKYFPSPNQLFIVICNFSLTVLQSVFFNTGWSVSLHQHYHPLTDDTVQVRHWHIHAFFAFHFSLGFLRIVLDSTLKPHRNHTQDFDLVPSLGRFYRK